MPKQQKAGTTRMGLTLDNEIVDRAAAEAARLQASTGLRVTVADVLKATLAKHLPPLGAAGKAVKKRG